MEISNHENKIGLFIKFDESCSVFVINPKRVKTFICSLEWLKV